MRLICAALLAAAAAGCVSSYAGSARPADDSLLDAPEWRAARGVPVILQETREDCGAAALAMVLAYFGDRVATSEIRSPRADALRDFARSRGFAAFCFFATVDDLERELADGRPVLVGLEKPQIDGTLPHYEVVVGLDRDGGRVATIDPARGLTVNSIEAFEREWAGSKRLSIIVGPTH